MNPNYDGGPFTDQWQADGPYDNPDEVLEAGGVGGVMRAMAAVLIDRGHDQRAVVDGVIEDAGRIEADLWDRYFGPGADAVAEALGLPAFPEEVQS